MSFFDFFGGIVKGIGRLGGKAVEGFGNLIGNEDIASFGRSIQEICSEKISAERSYERQTANVQSTERLSEILVSFSEGYLQQADTIEKASIGAVEDYYDALLELLSQSPNIAANQAGLKRLKASRTQIKNKIKGSVKDPLAKRMSLDDEECLRILKMDPGPEKKTAMNIFSQKIINSALQNTANKVRKTLNEQLENVDDYLLGIQEEQEREYSVLKEQYDSLMANGIKELRDREENCLEPAITMTGIQLVEKVIQV